MRLVAATLFSRVPKLPTVVTESAIWHCRNYGQFILGRRRRWRMLVQVSARLAERGNHGAGVMYG